MYTENQRRVAVDIAPVDTAAAEAFMKRICGVLDAGAQAAMISIGHRAGLFDVLAELAPSSSPAIAERAGLAERYVREWLAVMVTAGIVEYRPEDATYRLPAEHAACLTRRGQLGNVAVFAQHVALLGAMQEQTLHCLETGEGTRYGDYPCFHQMMAEDSEQTVVGSLFERVLPLAEGLQARLESGIDVLDAGCGRGRALMALAANYPASRFTGYDLCEDAIEAAARDARRRGLDNLSFEVYDMSGFDEVERYDLVTSFDAVHDQKHPQQLIDSIFRALKPSGIYLMQDIGGSARLENNLDFPMASLLYAISCVHCTPISIGQGGDGFGTMWGWETARAMLESAGFAGVEHSFLEHDPMNVWFVSRKEVRHAA